MVDGKKTLVADSGFERLNFAEVLDFTSDAVLACDMDEVITLANPAALKLLKVRGEDVLGRSVSRFISGDHVAVHEYMAARAARGEPVQQEETELLRGDGARVPVEMTMTLLSGGDGDPGGVCMVFREVTDRSAIRNRVRESRENFIRMLGLVPDLISIHDPDMNILYSNWKGFGRVPEERRVIGAKCHKVYRGYDEVCPDCQAMSVIESAQAFKTEARIADGSWVDLRVIPLLDDAGKVELVMEWVRDISDLKKGEEILRESETRFRKVIADLPGAVFAHSLDGDLLMVNESSSRYTGWSERELLGMNISDIDPESVARNDREQLWMVMRDKGRMTIQAEHVRKDGSTYPAEVHIRAIYLDGEPAILAMAYDITQRRKAERERVRLLASLSAKNSEMEQVLYVASHDLRSPLVNIEGYGRELENGIQDLRRMLESDRMDEKELRLIMDEDIPDALRFIRASASKMDSLLNGLLRLSRTGRASLRVTTLDMGQLVAKVLDSTEFMIKASRADVRVENLPPCRGDAVQVNQVFSNLVDNALKYLDPGRKGHIRISGLAQGPRCVYCVEDNGIGIHPDHQGKVFEIFHRLDPSRGHGEGLGLTIVRRILDRLEGDAWVESDHGRGSRFYVALPTA